MNLGNDSLVVCRYLRIDCNYYLIRYKLLWYSGLVCCRYVVFIEKYGWYVVDL